MSFCSSGTRSSRHLYTACTQMDETDQAVTDHSEVHTNGKCLDRLQRAPISPVSLKLQTGFYTDKRKGPMMVTRPFLFSVSCSVSNDKSSITNGCREDKFFTFCNYTSHNFCTVVSLIIYNKLAQVAVPAVSNELTCWYWEYLMGSFSNTSYVCDSKLSMRG